MHVSLLPSAPQEHVLLLGGRWFVVVDEAWERGSIQLGGDAGHRPGRLQCAGVAVLLLGLPWRQ